MRERLYISLLIWFGNVVIWIVLTFFIIEWSLAPGWFWLLFLSAYAIQAISYWLFLKQEFQRQREGQHRPGDINAIPDPPGLLGFYDRPEFSSGVATEDLNLASRFTDC